MTNLKTYTVNRAMHGDGREYERGDTRELTEVDAAALLESGALSLEGEEPRVREPAVRHTFGAAEQTGHLVMTSAVGDELAKAAFVKPKRPPAAA